MKDKTFTSYNEYLSIDVLLDASSFANGKSSELNFVISHQITELWFKLLINYLSIHESRQELGALLAAETVMKQINSIWEVFEHIQPKDFLEIREKLKGISGAESTQYAQVSALIKKGIKHCKTKEQIQVLSRIDSTFQKWKISHLHITQKLIGNLSGTGGTEGANFLKEKGSQPLITHENLNAY